MGNLWDSEAGAMDGAAFFLQLNTLYLLIDKAVITQQEAASVFTTTADQVREGSENGASPGIGEHVATKLESMAGWCLGYGGVL